MGVAEFAPEAQRAGLESRSFVAEGDYGINA
jgi:hypothetical protein